MITTIVAYAILGAIAGVLAGMLGVGGGIVIVPMLVIAFTYQGLPTDLIMHMALGTSLACIIFTSFSSALAHHRRKAVDWSIVRRISLGILLGTYFGSFVASKISAEYLQLFFALFLFYVASQMLMGKAPKASRNMPGFIGLSGAGLGIGLISSLVGIGGGTISVPFMIWHNIPMRNAIATSAAIGIPIAIAGSFGYFINGLNVPTLPEYSLGFIFLPALGGIVLFSMLTAPYGARLAHTLPIDRIKKYFAALLIIMGTKMLIGAF